jgi:hypothetical protein
LRQEETTPVLENICYLLLLLLLLLLLHGTDETLSQTAVFLVYGAWVQPNPYCFPYKPVCAPGFTDQDAQIVEKDPMAKVSGNS